MDNTGQRTKDTQGLNIVNVIKEKQNRCVWKLF